MCSIGWHGPPSGLAQHFLCLYLHSWDDKAKCHWAEKITCSQGWAPARKKDSSASPLAAGRCHSPHPSGTGWWQCLARSLMGFPIANWIFFSFSVQAVLRKWWKTSWKRESMVPLKRNACPIPVGLHGFSCLLSMMENSSICRVGRLLAINVKLILAAYIHWGENAVNTVYHAQDLHWEWHFDEI